MSTHLGELTFTTVQELENVLDHCVLQHQHVLGLQVDNSQQSHTHSSPVGCCGAACGSHHVLQQGQEAALGIVPRVSSKLRG